MNLYAQLQNSREDPRDQRRSEMKMEATFTEKSLKANEMLWKTSAISNEA